MSELKDSETKIASAETATPAPAALAATTTDTEKQISPAFAETPKIELPSIETPKSDAPIAEVATPAQSIEPSRPLETAKLIELLTSEPAAPSPAKDSAAPSIKPLAADKPASSPLEVDAPAIAKDSPAASRANRFALLAASVAFAASVGALAGALGATVIARPAPSAAESPTAAIDLTKLQDTIASVRSEVAALKTSLDSGARSSNAQFAKAAERFERIERAQASSSAQLAKSIEAFDRRTAAARDVTGSVQPQPAAAVPTAGPAPTPTQESLRGPVLAGWVVRNVHRNVAIIQGRRLGLIEVEAGDIVPGVGRIQSIRKQPDGKWIVVTSKGLITSAR